MKKTFIFFSFIMLLFGCSESDSSNNSNPEGTLVFGRFYGFCGGEECIEIFKLSPVALFEDTLDNYPTAENHNTNFVPLNANKFAQTKDLVNFFPMALFNESNTFIGSPDVADGGGLYIVYTKNGIQKKWYIDLVKENVPVNYHNFIDKVNEKIDLLQ
jgi:hypothetical protein